MYEPCSDDVFLVDDSTRKIGYSDCTSHSVDAVSEISSLNSYRSTTFQQPGLWRHLPNTMALIIICSFVHKIMIKTE